MTYFTRGLHFELLQSIAFWFATATPCFTIYYLFISLFIAFQ